jgi:hypothetical protein
MADLAAVVVYGLRVIYGDVKLDWLLMSNYYKQNPSPFENVTLSKKNVRMW